MLKKSYDSGEFVIVQLAVQSTELRPTNTRNQDFDQLVQSLKCTLKATISQTSQLHMLYLLFTDDALLKKCLQKRRSLRINFIIIL